MSKVTLYLKDTLKRKILLTTSCFLNKLISASLNSCRNIVTAVIESLSNLALIFRIITEVCWQHFSTLCFSASTEPFIHFRKQTDKRMSLNISGQASNQEDYLSLSGGCELDNTSQWEMARLSCGSTRKKCARPNSH